MHPDRPQPEPQPEPPIPDYETAECDHCGHQREIREDRDLCDSCAEDKAMAALSKIEPPEGGWPRGSDMDRL